tara:strand:- start:752 stop:1489 length:738 start_codon:yes stop_codon:yes gene_type:complete
MLNKLESFGIEDWGKFLHWKCEYEQRTGEKIHRAAMTASGDLTEDCSAWIQNEYGIQFSSEQVRLLAASTERGEVWTVSSEEPADACWPDLMQTHKETLKQNKKDYGCSSGAEGLIGRVKEAANRERIKRKVHLSKEYMDYINGKTWQERRNRYISERASIDGAAICELCSFEDVDWWKFNVHHNNYKDLDGSEPDTSLCCCCRQCHDFADAARTAMNGPLTDEKSWAINNQFPALFNCYGPESN